MIYLPQQQYRNAASNFHDNVHVRSLLEAKKNIMFGTCHVQHDRPAGSTLKKPYTP